MTPSAFKATRERLGLSVRTLAGILQVSPRLVRRIEAGQRNVSGPIEVIMTGLAVEHATGRDEFGLAPIAPDRGSG